MRKNAIAALIVVAAVAAILAWWKLPALRKAANIPAALRPNEPSPKHRSAAVVEGVTTQSPVSPSAPSTALPDWEKRLDRIVSLVGKVPAAELDTEIEDLAASLPQEDAMAVLNLQLLPDTDKMPVITTLCYLLIQRWAEKAPADAAQWLARVPESPFSHGAYRRVAAAWAGTDLASAEAWLARLPEGGNKTGAQYVVADQAAQQKEPGTALRLLASLPADAERDHLIRYAALQWATMDRDRAAAWVQQLSDAALRDPILVQMTIDWAVTEPAKAAEFARSSLPAGKDQDAAVATSVANWAVVAPEGAAAWAEQLPEGGLRETVWERFIEVWAKLDAAKAAAWLGRAPAGPARDKAVEAFATTIAAMSPDEADRWTDTIQNESLRTQVRSQLRQKDATAPLSSSQRTLDRQ